VKQITVFDKILIASRGEIAIRIHRTLKRLGIKSVGVFSDSDRDARHVVTCDESVWIGGAPAAESYLAGKHIIDACKRTGAEAVHPGYGFLSENPEFARQLADEGITFIGPTSEMIATMGDKIAAAKLAETTGIPVVPGHREAITNPNDAAISARDLGFPVMLKAVVGGGGKGIHLARTEDEVHDSFRLATEEAHSAFGDGRVFVEKFIEEPRHIEFQVLGDQHGNIIHLGERECSIQRRHQKIIEESPSPFLDQVTRHQMGEATVALARAISYTSVGTIEFMVDQQHNYYFLEMNTRLQVEHPVTELVTALDLVEWMIRVAAGERLALHQEDIRPRGWSIEARVYAEDPYHDFMPSTGRLVRYRTPQESSNVRVDDGAYEGGEVTRYYDPLIAKVITWDRDRNNAIRKMRMALDEFYIQGIHHNLNFLSALLANPRFLKGQFSTGFINAEYPKGFRPAPMNEHDYGAIVGAAVLMHLRYLQRAAQTSDKIPGYHVHLPQGWVVVVNDQFIPVKAQIMGDGFDVRFADQTLAVRSDWQVGEPVLRCTLNAQPKRFTVVRKGLGYTVKHLGAEVDVQVYATLAAEMIRKLPPKQPPDLSMYLVSPMPGLLRSVAVEEGEEVAPGKELCVVEAMKMQNILRAERSGRIAKIRVRAGDVLTIGQIILEFE
jgi:propionyl-CoA carboxylase alpha chain